MQDLINSMQNLFLNIYIIIPFVFAFLFLVVTYLKNPIYIKRISNILFLVCLIFSFILFISGDNYTASVFNINFSMNRLTSVFSFVATFIFLLISIFSKTFVFKLHRIYRAALFALYGLLNIITTTDNILCVILSSFWMFCIFYFLYICYTKDEQCKKNIIYQLVFDIFIVLICLFFIINGFAKFFVLNDIAFDFSNISKNMQVINPTLTITAFLGFLLLVFRFFIFIPFCSKIITVSNKVNPIIHNTVILTSIMAGYFLMVKTYSVFTNLFYEYQEFISFFLIINFLWFIVLSQRQDSLIKFATSLIPAFTSVSLFNFFTFKECSIAIYTYSSISNILSFCFLSFSFIALTQKIGTDSIEEFKKINAKNKILPFFVILAILNCAAVPLLSIFSSRFLTFINLFSGDFEGIFMNVIPPVLVCGCLFLTVGLLNILYKTFIEPIQIKTCHYDYLCRNEITVLFLLLFAVLIVGLFAYDIYGLFVQIYTLGDI